MAKILSIRSVDEDVIRLFSGGAAIRGITQAEYLQRLLELRCWAVTAVQLSSREDHGPAAAIEVLRKALTELDLWDTTA